LRHHGVAQPVGSAHHERRGHARAHPRAGAAT
jgi:hypothetical protein